MKNYEDMGVTLGAMVTRNMKRYRIQIIFYI